MATSVFLQAQSPATAPTPLIQQQISNSNRVVLPGNVHPMAKAAFDRGAVEESFQTPRMQLLLKRPADREASLKQYIADIHQKGSPSYHKWLTPDQLAKQYGPADSDIQTVTAWMQSQGFTVSKVSRAKTNIEFSATAGQIKSAFGTQIHKYMVNGVLHYANSTNPQIPAALAPVVNGIVRMNDFRPKAQIEVQGQATYSPKTHEAKPLWNYPIGSNESFFVAPGDFAVQYNTTPLTAAGVTGKGETIGIINDANVDLTLVNAFRTLFSLPANTPQVIVDGTDPGVNGDSIEAYLDVETAGAVAPAATVNLYIAADTSLASGLDLAAARAVDDDVAQVLSLSFGQCEAYNGTTENAYYNSLWEQAAAQGQTVMVSTGDSGSEGCFLNGQPVYGLGVNGFASTPFNVAVGGTDFYYSDYAQSASTGYPPSFGNYWASGTSVTPTTSILTVIPEQPWNSTQYGFNIAAAASGDPTFYADNNLTTPTGGGGGASSCVQSDGQGDCTSGGYPKPSWQSVLTPADTVRDLPDVSLFAANGFNYSSYAICATPGDCNTDGQSTSPETVTGVGGTSASSPAFAGIMALVAQKYGPQGQADYVLYPLAKQFPAAFHDVVAGSNNEPCVNNTTNQTACVAAADGSLSAGAYSATTGYDQASGLGSVDANALVTNWNSITFTGTTTTLALSPATIVHGANETLTASVTGATSGDVSFVTTAPLANNKGTYFATVGANDVATYITNALPGGTYSITAQYGGNGTAGVSASSPQTITVTPEASNINFSAYAVGLSNGSSSQTQVVTGTTYPYGTAFAADIQPVGTSVTQAGMTDGIATGTATFTDTGSAGATTVALNSQGFAEWSTGNFAIGAHSISAKYSGDPSFNASTSAAPITFTIAKGTPSVGIQPFLSGQQTGANLSVQVYVQYVGAGTAPTGSVTVTLGSQSQTAALAASSAGSNFAGGTNTYAIATVTFSSVPAGVAAISATYTGDTNWNAASGMTSFSTGSGTGLPTTTSLTVTPNTTSVNNATVFTLSSTVTGSSTGAAPTGSVFFFSNGNQIAQAALPTGAAGAAVTATTSVVGANVAGGVNQIVAAYSGDTVYLTSFSAPTSATVDQSDFTLAAQNQTVSVAANASGTAIVNLASESGFASNVNLTCASPASAITCTVNPGTVMVNGLATATVTINVGSGVVKNESKRLWYAGGTAAFACVLLFGIPARRRGWRGMLGLLLFAVLTANLGCGGGKSTVPPILQSPAATPTFSPAGGTYATTQSVTIADATAGSTIYYTTDGSTPTVSSTQYSAAISVASSETINAIATATGSNQSAVGSAAYTIGKATPPVSGTNPISHNVTIQVVTPSGTSTVVVTGTVGS